MSGRRQRGAELAGAQDDAVPLREIAGISQRELLTHLQGADEALAQEAWERWYRDVFAALWRSAYRVVRDRGLAEELVQDVFLRIWEQRQTLKIQGDAQVYVYGAVRHAAYNALRHNRVVDRHSAAVARTHDEADGRYGVDPSQRIAERETEQALLAVLAEVPLRDREILILRWREGWSFEEIGRALRISAGAARVVVSRQLRRLQPLLERLREELREP